MNVDSLSSIADGVDLVTPAHTLRQTAEGRATLANSARGDASGYAGRDRGERMTKWKAARFVAWDGEGIEDDNLHYPDALQRVLKAHTSLEVLEAGRGSHKYVILANSVGDSIVAPGGVQCAEAFEMMLSCAVRDPLAIHVIFAGGYDVNMILSTAMSRNQARILADLGRVTMRLGEKRYRITYHPRHTFEVSEEVWNEQTQRPMSLRRFCLWDVFGSFQSSFVKACQRTLPDNDLLELEHIQVMKERRGSFRMSDLADMLSYCRAELRALVRLAECDKASFEAAGFMATRWDGAGAKASAVLRQRGVGAHKQETPEHLSIPVQAAYAGGRIESYRFGTYRGPMYTLDIRSAYPWAATYLPSLAGGWWEHVRNVGPDGPDEFSVWLMSYRGAKANDLHPLFWRSGDGRICYPQHTEGWYWAPEVWGALQHADGRVKVMDGWRFHPATDERPFSFVPDLFHARQRLEASVKGRGWPLKLALNSLYGKMAQQVGAKDGRPPRWHQLEWAGWITSKCRATMYEVGARNREQVISIETDGMSLMGSPDDLLLSRVGPNLGDFEVVPYDGGTWVQSGIYWLHDGDGWHDPKVRGVGAGVLDREAFELLWDHDEFGALTFDVTRFRGLVTSSISEGRWGDWCQWVQEPRDITACPHGKRVHVRDECRVCAGLGGMLHDTLPTGGGSRSALHSLAWTDKVGRGVANEWWLDTLDQEDTE